MKKTFELLFCFICIHLCIGALWIGYYFGKVNGDEMIFHLLVPLSGVNNDTFISYFLLGILPSIIISVLFYILINKLFFKKRKILLFLLFIISFCFFIFKLDINSYLVDQAIQSNFIEENYVNPALIEIVAPDKKRNLIFIFLESFESSYSSVKNGGIMKKNLIPKLTKVAKENISFSNGEKLGGALYMTGSSWTVASMVAHTSGLPLKINFSSNGIIDFNNFMPNVITLGDILKDNGYDNYLIAGSDTNYGSRKNYFEQHGDYKIYDVNNALADGEISEKIWWGFDDNKLFELARKQLLEIAKKDRSFNYTMLTVDTHFEDGYLSNDCDLKFNDQYSNVIYCSDKKIYEFLEWLQEQDFYDDTTVVLVGDHKTMDTDFFDNISSNYIRTNYNVFINSAVDTDNLYNRKFTSYDLFPTTLASIGFSLEGNRLGLGSNLFSTEETIIEKYGYDYVFRELKRRSTFYNNNFLAYK